MQDFVFLYTKRTRLKNTPYIYIGKILGYLPHPLIDYETHATNAKPPKPYPIVRSKTPKAAQPQSLPPATDNMTHTKSTCSAPQQLSPRPTALAFHHVTDEM